MTEEYFWGALEYRLCRELANMSEGRRRGLWCDGIYPFQYQLDGPAPSIIGHAWICDTGQEKWTFIFLLPRAYDSYAAIDWSKLYPPEHRTGWLALDFGAKHVRIELAALNIT